MTLPSLRLGVDLGGTKIEIAALDAASSVRLRRRVQTPAGDYDGIVRAVAQLVKDAETELGERGSVGIGIPGAPSRIDGLIKNANSTALIGKPFVRDVEALLERPVRVANDANCFVLSEAANGAARGAEVAFGVILGTGVGGAIAIRGQVIEGANAIAGEWGHNPLPWPHEDELPGPLCYCGKRGCLETWLCGPALGRQYEASSGARAIATEIAERAAAGERHAQACMEAYEDRLARGLATVINVLDPDVIVVGGGVSKIDRLYENVRGRLARYVFSDDLRTEVRRNEHGDSSGVLGAAMLT